MILDFFLFRNRVQTEGVCEAHGSHFITLSLVGVWGLSTHPHTLAYRLMGLPSSLDFIGHLCRQRALRQVALNLVSSGCLSCASVQAGEQCPAPCAHVTRKRSPAGSPSACGLLWGLSRARARSQLRCRAVRSRAWSAAMCSLAAGNGGSLAWAAGQGRAGAGLGADGVLCRPRRRAGAGAPGAVGQRRRRGLGGRGRGR